MRRRSVLGLAISIVLLAAILPLAYSAAQRFAVTGLSFEFDRLELVNFEMPENSLKRILEGNIDAIGLAGELAKVAADENYRNQLYLDTIANTRFNYDVFLKVHNPFFVDAVVDRATINIKVNDHAMSRQIVLSKQQTISAGSSSIVELKDISFTLADVSNIATLTASNDYRLVIDMAVTSYYPTLLIGDVTVPANVNIKTFIVPPKPSFENNSFRMISDTVNSYQLSIRNNYELPLYGKLQVGAYKGSLQCPSGCTPKNGMFTLVRTWVYENHNNFAVALLDTFQQATDPYTVLSYSDVTLDAGQSKSFNIGDPDLRSNSQSSFVLRWEPDYYRIPYTTTTEIAGTYSTAKSDYFSIADLKPTLGEYGVVAAALSEQAVYYVTRDFGYLGDVQFTSAKYETVALNQPVTQSTTQPVSQPSNAPNVEPAQARHTTLTAKTSVSNPDDAEFITIHGKLQEMNGNGVADERIDIKRSGVPFLESVLGSVHTDSDGNYELMWQADRSMTSNGRMSIFAIHEGNQAYSRSVSQDLIINVGYVSGVSSPEFLSTTLTAASSSYDVDNGDSIEFSGALLDENGDGVANEKIDILRTNFVGIVDPLYGTGHTSADGTYSIMIEANLDNANSDGTVDLYALHEQGRWYGQSSSDIVQIKINRQETDQKSGFHSITIILEVYDPETEEWGNSARIEDGQLLRFRGSMIDNESDPVPSETVYLQERDFPSFENLDSTITNSGGEFLFERVAEHSQADGDGDAEFFAMHLESQHYGSNVSYPDLYVEIYE
jgi:protocatechuate 3,4-dioxygenase beta subunit